MIYSSSTLELLLEWELPALHLVWETHDSYWLEIQCPTFQGKATECGNIPKSSGSLWLNFCFSRNKPSIAERLLEQCLFPMTRLYIPYPTETWIILNLSPSLLPFPTSTSSVLHLQHPPSGRRSGIAVAGKRSLWHHLLRTGGTKPIQDLRLISHRKGPVPNAVPEEGSGTLSVCFQDESLGNICTCRHIMEKSPVNPTFEATPSHKHKTTFHLYLKGFFFQCFTSRLEAQAAPSLEDFLPVLLLWEFAIQLGVFGMQPLDMQNSTGTGS